MLNLGQNPVNKSVRDAEIFNVIFPDSIKQIIMNSITEKMPQPEEVIFSLDESGLPVTTQMNNTSHSDHYNNVKDTIRNIAKINYKSFSNLL